jgi:kynurenine formamidase
MTKKWIDFSQIDYDPAHVANSEMGSHWDSPVHFYREGKRLDQFPLEKFAGPGCVLDIPKGESEAVTVEDLEKSEVEIRKGDMLFIYTAWDQHMGTLKYHYHPYLTMEATEWLVDKGISVLGVDTMGPDDPMLKFTPNPKWPVHHLLSKNDILIVEGLGSMKEDAGKRVIVYSFPLRLMTYKGIPARVVVELDE